MWLTRKPLEADPVTATGTPTAQQESQVERSDVSILVGVQTNDSRVWIRRDQPPFPKQEGQVERTGVTAIVHVRRARATIRRQLVRAYVNLLFARPPVAEQEGEVEWSDVGIVVDIGAAVGFGRAGAPSAQENG